MNYTMPEHIHVFFHNLRGYNLFCPIQVLDNHKKNDLCLDHLVSLWYWSVATTSKHYVLMRLRPLEFLELFQVLIQSLEILVDNFFKGGSDFFPILNQSFDGHMHTSLSVQSRNQLQQIQKQVYLPVYNFTAAWRIIDYYADYAHAQTVWSVFNMWMYGDFNNLCIC